VRPRYPRQESPAPPLVREREAAGVPEHVRVHLERQPAGTHRAGIACYAVGEVSLRDDISALWAAFRSLDAEHRLQFLQAAAKWQEALIHWQGRPSLSFTLMAVSCEALKPASADQRQNCYDVIKALLGRQVVDELRHNPFPAQQVRSTHLHSGEFHGSELIMANFMRTYEDPSFRDAHRTMAKVTPSTIFATMAEQDADLLEVLIRQVTKD
jgi:hypothetical protein